jgi:hypothetical protein
MKLKFHEVKLEETGASAGPEDGANGRLELSLLDPERQRLLHVNVTIFLPKNREVTLEGLQESARTDAIEVLKKALNVLEKHDIPDLEKMAEERSR